MQRESGIGADTAARLVRLYGSETPALVGRGTAPLVPGAPVLACEVEHAVCALGAVTLTDVVYRRLRTALYVPSARESGIEPAAAILAGLLGWDDARRRAEVEATRARLAADLAFARPPTPGTGARTA